MLSRRWLGFAVFVAVLAGVCVRLGIWQLDRLHQRLADNEVIAANLAADPVAVDTVSGSGEGTDAQWKSVIVTGTYDPTDQFVVKYQTRDSQPGVDVVTPVVTGDGSVVLVDRGWITSRNTTGAVADIPAPPTGTVRVTGWWRPDSTAEQSAIVPSDHQVRAISSAGVAAVLDPPVQPGYVNMLAQAPSTSASAFAPEPRPQMGQGPHFFYALQWFFFAGLAVFGWFYFAWTEAHPKQPRRRGDGYSARRAPPSTGSIAPEMNEAAGETRKAAARPNSAG